MPAGSRRRLHVLQCIVVFALGACVGAAAAAPAPLQAPAPALATSFGKCLNNGLGLQRTGYADFVAGKPTRLKLLKAFWSTRKPAVDLTVVTGLTVSRLDQLEAQCASWKGPLSAAVYLVLQDSNKDALSESSKKQLVEAVVHLAALHKRMETAGGCQLDAALLYETVADATMPALLPINTMRNYALLQARTRLVAMVDVDLLVSKTLFDWVALPNNYQRLASDCANKTMYVLPAFETAPACDIEAAHAVAGRAVGCSKPALKDMVQRREVHQFALYLYAKGHRATRYQRWFETREQMGYDIEWYQGYEPWFIIDRTLNPFYDSRFRGYGWNKVTHVTTTHFQGFKFKVHPAGFLVHRQHDVSKAGTMYQKQKKQYEKEVQAAGPKGQRSRNTSLAGMTHRFRDQVLAALAQGSYTPVVDSSISQCVRALPWWSKAA